jgi:hypothetical protein
LSIIYGKDNKASLYAGLDSQLKQARMRPAPVQLKIIQ